MGLFSRGKSPSLSLIDTSGYESAYQQARGGQPTDYGDIETFYTPEIQQAVLAEMTRSYQEQGAQDQAAISGGSIRSGFGVGNTSREQARRAKAESGMLDQIINAHVANAANIEAQRTQQAQEQQQRQFQTEELLKNQDQANELRKLGYTEQFNQQQQDISAQNSADRMNMIAGGIGGLGQLGGQWLGSMNFGQPKPTNTSAMPGLGLESMSQAARRAAMTPLGQPVEISEDLFWGAR